MKVNNFCFIASVIVLFVSFSITSAQTTTPTTNTNSTSSQTVVTESVPVTNATVAPEPVGDSADCNRMEGDELERIKFLKNKTDEQIKELIFQCEKNKIKTVPMLLSYKTVRDSFGKRIGESFVVVQVNIQNKSSRNEFYVTDLQVWLDPNQCGKAANFYQNIKFKLPEKATPEQVAAYETNPNVIACLLNFDKYFQYPIALEPIQSDRVMNVSAAGVYRSRRKISFAAANFLASLGSVFTGLKLLGRDGVNAFGFLGSTVIPSAETAIPNMSKEKMDNLKDALGEETIIVKPNSSKVINIFIETDSFFNKETFKQYKATLKKTDENALAFRRMLKLFIVSSVDGILISSDSKKINIPPTGIVPTNR